MSTVVKRLRLAVPAFALGCLLIPLIDTHGSPLPDAQDKAKAKDKDKEKDKGGPERGSIVEDRTARKLLEAGDARLEAGEPAKAIEVWQSVIERYPRSKVRFDAFLKLGNHLLTKERAFDRARTYFESASGEDNPNEEQRAEATLKTGVCYFEGRNYGKTFKYMRDVIEKYPVSPQVNQAYYYIGLGHFQQGHYSRAITALERVGTALPPPEIGPDGKPKSTAELLEANKRLFIRIEDADLAALEVGKTVPVKVESTSGDVETVECVAIGRNVRVVVGTIPTALGKADPGNGRLELRGNDVVKITYRDMHTAAGAKENLVVKNIPVVGTATAAITDGAYAETLQGVVLGRGVHLQVVDADFDLTDGADILKGTVEVYREKTPEEIAAEAGPGGVAPMPPAGTKPDPNKLDRFKKIDKVDVVLTEAKIIRIAPENTPLILIPVEEPKKDGEPGKDEPKKEEPKKEEPKKEEPKKEDVKPPEPPKDDGTIHSGTFRAVVALEKSETPNLTDQILQAQPNDLIVFTYIDAKNSTGESRTVVFKARVVEGSLGSVRVSQTQISDQELRVKTQLKTASALTNIGNRYKEFGLKQHADTKYQQAMTMCEEISTEAQKLGGRTLEETYVQLWKIYFEMDKLDLAAAMSQRLQRDFPNSEFVDAALLSLATVARKQNQFQRAIGIYTSVLRLEKSPLRGEAQFGIAECYEEMAKAVEGQQSAQLYDQSFQEYKKVFDQFPDSGRVGEAVAKMANYYYVQKDYARAIDVFETVLRTHPDAKFLDVILFNYGRCLYRLDKKADARKQFDQMIADFPESPLAPDAKKISEALRKGGN
ncbi:MAG: tetratricopeptide repeat protein [Planctomycetes bacterium]|nr:tetratricopeptide repeat protein [Planctomycetota bacterium]